MEIFKRVIVAVIAALGISLLSPLSSNAALIQNGAAPGPKWGSPNTGGPFTKSCPSGYVVTGVAVAENESFGYTRGFEFTCTEILENGTLGSTSTTITQVTSNPRDRSSICPTGYALIGVRVLLRWDPNNNAIYYVNDLGANCAKFVDKSQTFNANMARNVKLGANNEYQDRDSSCSSGFVTGFDGRSGAGLDYAGVMCSTFTDENEGKPSPSYLVIKESPKISLSDISMICSAGEYLFMRSGAFEEKSVVTERVFSLLRDSTIITTLTVTETNQASFDKSTIAGTYTCSEQVRQESSLAISLSSSKLTQLDAAKRAYKADLKKNAQARPSRDNASREIYLDARRAASEQAGKSRAELISGSSDFFSKLRDISLTYSEQVSSARDDFQTALSESYIAFEAANKKSLSDYFQALKSAGISILVEAP